MNKKCIGIFETEELSISAIKKLKTNGYADDEISILAKQNEKVATIKNETNSHAQNEREVAGGILAQAGAISHDCGTVGVLGTLIDLGFDETNAKKYENYFNQGNILIIVEDKGNRDKVHSNFYQNESLNRDSYRLKERYGLTKKETDS